MSETMSKAAGVLPRRAVPLHQTEITIRNRDSWYGEIQALKDVSRTLPETQVTGLIGLSGFGKSTLPGVLNRLCNLYPGQWVSGEVPLDGKDGLGSDVDVKSLRSCVGMVFQEPTTVPMSIYDTIAFGLKLREHLSRADRDNRVEGSLVRAGLWNEVKDRLADRADSLSGGQQPRLCLARTLATRPEVILLDQPTSALDPLNMAKIEDLKKHVTIAVVTHNLQQAARCADQMAFFYLGKIIKVGRATAIFTAPRHQQTSHCIAGQFG